MNVSSLACGATARARRRLRVSNRPRLEGLESRRLLSSVLVARGSASAALMHESAPEAIHAASLEASQIVLSANFDLRLAGKTLAITATVLPTSGAGEPTGAVSVAIDGGAPASIPLVSMAGEATAFYTTPALAVGPHTVAFSYAGDAQFAASADATATIQAVSIAEYATGGRTRLPAGVAVTSDGIAWIAEASKGAIARFDVTQPANITEAAVPTSDGAPAGIAAGPGTSVYFTETLGNKIGFFDASRPSVFAEATIPTANSAPFGIVEGYGGLMYFTETAADQIGVLEPATGRVIKEIPLPAGMSSPTGIVYDAATQRLYFAATDSGSIGVLDPTTDAITSSAWVDSGVSPLGITVGSDGEIWFTESNTGSIGRYDPAADAVQHYVIGPGNSTPAGIVTGDSGKLFVTEALGNRIVWVDPAAPTVANEIPVSTALAVPFGIAYSSHFGVSFFTEAVGDRIGVLGGSGSTGVAAVAATASAGMVEYPLPGGGGGDYSVVIGSIDGDVWTTEAVGGVIDRVDPATGAVLARIVPTTADSRPMGLVEGPGGLWFTEGVGKVGRIDPSTNTVAAEYALPSAASGPTGPLGIATAGGKLYIAESLADKIAVLDPADPTNIVEIDVPTADAGPVGIATGADGRLYFTELNAGKIGVLDPTTNTIVEVSIGSTSGPAQIISNGGSLLYFTEAGANAIGVFDASTMTVTHTYSLATSFQTPWGLALDHAGRLWYATLLGNKLGAIDLATGAMSSVALPTALAGPTGVAVAGDGDVWVGEFLAGSLARVDVNPTVLTATFTSVAVAPETSLAGQPVTFTATVSIAIPERGASARMKTIRASQALGDVVFTIDGVDQPPVPLVAAAAGGQATFTITTLAVGRHVVTARFTGTDSWAPSGSPNSVTEVVNAPTVVVVAASAKSVTYGQTVVFTAVVGPATAVPAGSPSVTGAVVFTVDGKAQAPLALSTVNGMGAAQFAAPGLGVGTHTVTAAYLPDGYYLPQSTRTPTTVVVTPATGVGPRVVGVQRYGYHTIPTALVLTFDQPLDAARAQDPANYRILGAGGATIPIARAVYDPARRTVTLWPTQLVALHRSYLLVVNGAAPGGLTDAQGRYLDGSGKGRPGTNFLAVLGGWNLAGAHPPAAAVVVTSTPATKLPHGPVFRRPT